MNQLELGAFVNLTESDVDVRVGPGVIVPRPRHGESMGRIEEARGLLEKVIAAETTSAEAQAAKDRLATNVYRKGP